jgi:hypothetical protein
MVEMEPEWSRTVSAALHGALLISLALPLAKALVVKKSLVLLVSHALPLAEALMVKQSPVQMTQSLTFL